VTLAARGAFARVVPALFAALAALDRLGVQGGGRRLGVPSGLDAHEAAERVMDAVPRAVFAPRGEPAVRGVVGHQVAREHPPLASRAQHVEDRIEDEAVVVLAWGSAFAQVAHGKQGFDDPPHRIGEVGRIAWPLVGPGILTLAHTT